MNPLSHAIGFCIVTALLAVAYATLYCVILIGIFWTALKNTLRRVKSAFHRRVGVSITMPDFSSEEERRKYIEEFKAKWQNYHRGFNYLEISQRMIPTSKRFTQGDK